LGVTIPEMVKALQKFEALTGIVLSKAGGTGQILKKRVRQLEEEVKSLQASQRRYSTSDTASPFGRNLDAPRRVTMTNMQKRVNSSDGIMRTLSPMRMEVQNIEDHNADKLAESPTRKMKAMQHHEFKTQLETVNEEREQLLLELQKLKENSKCNDIMAIRSLRQEFSRVKNENEILQDKVNTLTETVQNLIKETNPTLGCEHCLNDPSLLVRVDTNRVKEARPNISKVDQRLSIIAVSNDNLDKEHKELQEAVHELHQQKYAAEMDKYQLNLDVDRVQRECTSTKEKERKLSQVVQHLTVKKETILKEFEDKKNSFEILKQNTGSLKSVLGDINIDQNNATACSIEELKSTIQRMQTIIVGLAKHNRQLEKQLQSTSE